MPIARNWEFTLLPLCVVAWLALACTSPHAAETFKPPEWAYPVMEEDRGREPDDGILRSVEGSDLRVPQPEVNNPFGPVDWFPGEHPKMPDIVAYGRKPDAWACSLCHLPSGSGHPDSANLSGLSSRYIVQQLKDFQSGARKSSNPDRPGIMVKIAKALTDEEMQAAADYFASLPQIKWNEVIEAETVPETYVGRGNMRHPLIGGGEEPLGSRIIELPTDSTRAKLRDPHSSFVAYVPPGSVAKGKELAELGGDGRTFPCAMCHGPELKGSSVVPGIAGRSPSYLARQMIDMQQGARDGEYAVLMIGMVPNLSEEDILNLSAYIGSLEP